MLPSGFIIIHNPPPNAPILINSVQNSRMLFAILYLLLIILILLCAPVRSNNRIRIGVYRDLHVAYVCIKVFASSRLFAIFLHNKVFAIRHGVSVDFEIFAQPYYALFGGVNFINAIQEAIHISLYSSLLFS